MTSPLTSTEPDWLDEILQHLQIEAIDYHSKDLYNLRRGRAMRNEAHAAITAHLLAAVEEVIGEDDPGPEFEDDPDGKHGVFTEIGFNNAVKSIQFDYKSVGERNHLRREQRQRLAVLVTSKNKGV